MTILAIISNAFNPFKREDVTRIKVIVAIDKAFSKLLIIKGFTYKGNKGC